MKNDTLLTITSLVAIVLTSIHITDDIVRGFEPGTIKHVQTIGVLLAWTLGATLLVGRWPGYLILVLGSVLAAGIPVLHFSGRGVGELAKTDGGGFFVWTLLALGVTGWLALILTVRGWWGLRSRSPALRG